MRKEQPKQSGGINKQPSLRDYWMNPPGSVPKLVQEPKRRPASSIPSVTTPTLWQASGEPGTPYAQLEPVAERRLVAASGNNTQMLRERVMRRGVTSLSNAELLSVVLRTGQGQEHIVPLIHTLLTSYSMQQLLNVDFGQLREEYGLGEAKAAQLQATLEVARRLTLPSENEKYTIKSPADAAALVRTELEYLNHEELWVLLLDTKNGVEANFRMYQGTIDQSVLRAAEIFRPAITRNCPNIIICHNHPSGDPTPSQEDITVTEQLVQAGKLLNIELLDHLVIGSNGRFTSLKERLRW